MNIQAKASIGDKVYFLKQIKHTCCPVCNGTDKIHIGTADTLTKSVEEQTITELMTGNVREYSCPECNGKGIVRTIGQPKYEVGGGTVITVEVTLNRSICIIRCGSPLTIFDFARWIEIISGSPQISSADVGISVRPSR